MKASITIQGVDGKYIMRARGDKVSLREIEVKWSGNHDGYDLFSGVGQPPNGRFIGIDENSLAWIQDGNENEYEYKIITKIK